MLVDVLFVEDNAYKRRSIVDFICTLFPEVCVDEAFSFSSGCRALESKTYQLLLLDISMPTYDKGEGEIGGRFRTFGGREIARKAIRRGISTPVLFITQYESFSDKGRSLSLSDLNDELAKECGGSYLGLVRYDSARSDWKDDLARVLGRWKNENNNC